MPLNNDLQYCIKYQDSFPNDYKTAVNFFACSIDTNAEYWAETTEHFAAINKCKIAAINILER